MSDFQRARTADQRAERQERILDVATAMLQEMPVPELSLNELSRRVGLAKSNVIRYFESREAVLLELLDRQARQFLDDVRAALPRAPDLAAPLPTRARSVAATVAACFDARPMLCELLSAQSGVLERNVSVEGARRFKLSARDNLNALAETLQHQLPELGALRSADGARIIVVIAGAIWTQSHPAPTVQAAIDSEPTLSFFTVSFPDTLEATVFTLLTGLLASSDAPTPGPSE